MCLVLGSWWIKYQQLLSPNMNRVDSIRKTLWGQQLREENGDGPQAGSGSRWVPAHSVVSPPRNLEAGALAQIETLVPTQAADLAPWACQKSGSRGRSRMEYCKGSRVAEKVR